MALSMERLRSVFSDLRRSILAEEHLRLGFSGTLADLRERAASSTERTRIGKRSPFLYTSLDIRIDERSNTLQLRVSRYALHVFPYPNVYIFRGSVLNRENQDSVLLVDGDLRWKPFLRTLTLGWLTVVALWTGFVAATLLMTWAGVAFSEDLYGLGFALLLSLALLLFGVLVAKLLAFVDRGAKRLLATELANLGFHFL
jgi:hypothetical protein